MVENKQEELKNWFDNYDKPKEDQEGQLPIFKMKLLPGKLTRSEAIEFVTDGEPKTTMFGETITFNIKNGGIDYIWFIRKTQYNLLNPIAKESKKGSIVGRKAVVERVGSGQKETKWAITFE